jgi:CubicO group peptidase (beta-lactamase class C family)
VDGRGVGRFLAEEICGPAGLEFAFGLSPSQQARGGGPDRPGRRVPGG